MPTGKELLDKVNSIKNSEGAVGIERNKATIDGALIGMSAGLFYGFAKKQSLIMWGMLGAVAGSVISRALMPK